MDINVKFEAKEISLRVAPIVQELSELLLKSDTPDLDKLQENLLQDIKAHQDSGECKLKCVKSGIYIER